MNIIATLLVRNEEEILKECIEHHLSHGVKNIVATDNNSTDNTKSILESYKEVITVIDELEDNYQQGKWVTRMAQLASRFKPDWVVHIDADEFWHGLENLSQIPEDIGVVYLPQHYYEHLPVDGLTYGNFKRHQMPYFVKMSSGGRLVHRPSSDIVVTQGNHYVHNFKGNAFQLNSDLISMHHYSIRSYEQWEKKTVAGGRAYEKYPGSHGDGIHWRRAYQLWKEGKLREEYDNMVLREIHKKINNREISITPYYT